MVPDMPAGQPGRPVVLVVDDEAAIRAFICEYLRDRGFHTFGVETADNAVRLLNLGVAADLVFSDAGMPGERDGFGLAEWVAEHRPDLPVILTSGDTAEESASIRHAEMLPQPLEMDSAVYRIRQAIARCRPAAN